jgi:hypothetical protein
MDDDNVGVHNDFPCQAAAKAFGAGLPPIVMAERKKARAASGHVNMMKKKGTGGASRKLQKASQRMMRRTALVECNLFSGKRVCLRVCDMYSRSAD